ncbi:MAG: thioredoxin [Clostridia bacterium]|nr:thioredoxin [Clostridia bacterium]
MAVITINSNNFKTEVLESKVPVLADFNATWCGPCRSMKPMLDQLAEENKGYKIVSIDVDDNSELAEEYDVSSIPCLVVFRDGEEVNRSVGLIPKDMINALVEG